MKYLFGLAICILVSGCQPRCTAHFGEHTWGQWVEVTPGIVAFELPKLDVD